MQGVIAACWKPRQLLLVQHLQLPVPATGYPTFVDACSNHAVWIVYQGASIAVPVDVGEKIFL